MHEITITSIQIIAIAIATAQLIYLHIIHKEISPGTEEYSLILKDGNPVHQYNEAKAVLEKINEARPGGIFQKIWEYEIPKGEKTWLGTRSARRHFRFNIKANNQDLQGMIRIQTRRDGLTDWTAPVNQDVAIPKGKEIKRRKIEVFFLPQPTNGGEIPEADEIHFTIPITVKWF